MTARFEGGAFVIRRPDGTIKFDSDEGLFHGVNELSGSFTLPERQARTQTTGGLVTYPDRVDVTTDFAVKACHPSCTHVIGFARYSNVGGGGIPDELQGTWLDASGTRISEWNGWGALHGLDGSGPYYFALGTIALHTFYCSGGNLRFRERCVMLASEWDLSGANGTSVLTRPESLVEYQILTGFFL